MAVMACFENICDFCFCQTQQSYWFVVKIINRRKSSTNKKEDNFGTI